MRLKIIIMLLKPSIFCLSIFLFLSCAQERKTKSDEDKNYTGNEITELNTHMAQGWNTWNTRSVLSHVLLPEGFAINLYVKDSQSGRTLTEALIGRLEDDVERVIPGMHSYDGSYTELELKWHNIDIQVRSAEIGNDFFLLINPVQTSVFDSLIIHPQFLWNKKGEVNIDKNVIVGQSPLSKIEIIVNGNQIEAQTEKILVSLGNPIAISTNNERSIEDIESIVNKAKQDFEKKKSKYNEVLDLYDPMQTVLGWNVIYEPIEDRVITPVSRVWNCEWNGWVLFDWDTYFASYMLSLDNKALAYANAIAITNEITKNGFIPNFASSRGKSNDRSQPPVGSYIVKKIFDRYQEKWFLVEVFDELLTWNRWWENNRDVGGYLCWGTDTYNKRPSSAFADMEVGKKQGAMWESGLDNSPMYDDATYDSITNRLMLADVGLMSLYILDCKSLAEIAKILGKPEVAKELTNRGQKYSSNLETLWDDEFGLYLNKDLVKDELSYRLSPTLFYPLLAKVPSKTKAKRMIEEHFYNPDEFWGEYIIPSIARNDVAYNDNDYWRGRIWGPMNFLVYLGIRNYDFPEAGKDLVEKSKNLILKSWIEEHYIYENYNSMTGQGDDVTNSDKFYHWGALLSFISIIDEGYLELSHQSIDTD